MIVPAAIFTAFNLGGDGAGGWGIPMATDIAFAIGVLSLAGSRVPFSLKIFLLALAVADDLGAIAVIAIFYTDEIAVDALLVAAGFIALILVMRKVAVRDPVAYLVVGGFLWVAVHESGIHATVAGVILGLLTPAYGYFSNSVVKTQQWPSPAFAAGAMRPCSTGQVPCSRKDYRVLNQKLRAMIFDAGDAFRRPVRQAWMLRPGSRKSCDTAPPGRGAIRAAAAEFVAAGAPLPAYGNAPLYLSYNILKLFTGAVVGVIKPPRVTKIQLRIRLSLFCIRGL
jgi:hypothetical protein